MTEMSELSEKNFKAAIMKMLHDQLQTCLKQMKKTESLSKEIERLANKQKIKEEPN